MPDKPSHTILTWLYVYVEGRGGGGRGRWYLTKLRITYISYHYNYCRMTDDSDGTYHHRLILPLPVRSTGCLHQKARTRRKCDGHPGGCWMRFQQSRLSEQYVLVLLLIVSEGTC